MWDPRLESTYGQKDFLSIMSGNIFCRTVLREKFYEAGGQSRREKLGGWS